MSGLEMLSLEAVHLYTHKMALVIHVSSAEPASQSGVEKAIPSGH